MEATDFGHVIVGVHTTGELLELKSRKARLTLSRVQDSIETYPLKTSRTMRSISQTMQPKKLKQSNAADLCYSVADLNREFPNDDACLEYIKEQRWPNSVTQCAKCTLERKHYRVTGRTAYACDHCGNHIYPLKGTVFARSTTPLKTWFYVMYLMASTGCGITAKQVQRETGVTYKTAWRTICHLRQLIVSKQAQPAHSILDIDNPNVLRIRQNHGLPTVPQPEVDSLPAYLDKTRIVLHR
jgi:transposase-like protein